MIGFSSFSKTPETSLAAQVCIDKIRTFSPQHTAGFSSPLFTMIDIANRLERDPGTARHIWVIRDNKQRQTADAHTRISAWPLRFSATARASEKPLLYLTSSATSAELCALSNESAHRGILCNDIETQPSRWPKGAHPWVPLWLVANPRCVPFDPASGAEAHAIALAALQSLYVEGNEGFYYMALHDEPNDFIAPISGLSASQALKGMYRLSGVEVDSGQSRVRLLGAGLALQSVVAAAQLLREDWGVASELWSCPSYTRLARDADKAQRWNRLHPGMPRRSAHLLDCLDVEDWPVVAVTGYARHVAEQIGAHVKSRFVAIGADSTGTTMGRVDKHWIVVLALQALAQEGVINQARVEQAMERYLLQ
ncbi:pyruvate dehydrogenase [Pseudomonas sp. SWRI102]|uniref:Pyruvate dehydrogenase n=1 Tax=Pseudomonas marvdashtae TaxID=2745500 RepID=A0A923FQM9_9PSED|nr:pyruvate dehydrogenase [Pseudomonas marvdashtae]MBV4553770.1 pyruvate dehydrogenase [Pseudomonas marvdashtae]